MTEDAYTLICGTAGINLRASASRLVSRAKRRYNSAQHIHADDRSDQSVAEYVQYPRADAMDIWAKSVVNAVNEFKSESTVRVLSAHLTLYEKTSNVFFSPVDISALSQDFKPDRLILLIDDIYDMYARLEQSNPNTGEPGFLAEATTIADAEDRFSGNFRHLSPDGVVDLTAGERRKIRAELRVDMLRLLLTWRRSEMIVAENLAAQLRIPLYLIGVKHPYTLADELLNPHRVPIAAYVSHPITNIRRRAAQDGDWSYATELNKIPAKFADAGVVTIMPTAIDELRVGTLSTHSGERLLYDTAATSRWPLMNYPINAACTGDIVDELPVDLETLDEDRGWASGLLRSVAGMITTEVPFRDHYIVGNTQHFLVFRPRENGSLFSNGVIREIRHFQRKKESKNTVYQVSNAQLVVVHSPSDVASVLKTATYSDLPDYSPTMISLLKENEVPSLVNDQKELLSGESINGLLQTQHPKMDTVQLIRAIVLREMAREWICSQLTQVRERAAWVRIYITDDYLSPEFIESVSETFQHPLEADNAPTINDANLILNPRSIVDKIVDWKNWHPVPWDRILSNDVAGNFISSAKFDTAFNAF